MFTEFIEWSNREGLTINLEKTTFVINAWIKIGETYVQEWAEWVISICKGLCTKFNTIKYIKII